MSRSTPQGIMKKYKSYIISVIIALAIGGISGLISMGGMEKYSQVDSPPLSPPSWLFPIVWTILYVLMGISAARIYKSEKPNVAPALWVYGLQLMVNFFWPIIFFSFGAYTFAAVWLILLLVLVAVMIVCFYKIDRTAAYLQIPYLIWLLFAAYLNIGVAWLNKG